MSGSILGGIGFNNDAMQYEGNQACGLQNAIRSAPTIGENIERRLQHCRDEIASMEASIKSLEATRAKFDKANMLDVKVDEFLSLLRY